MPLHKTPNNALAAFNSYTIRRIRLIKHIAPNTEHRIKHLSLVKKISYVHFLHSIFLFGCAYYVHHILWIKFKYQVNNRARSFHEDLYFDGDYSHKSHTLAYILIHIIYKYIERYWLRNIRKFFLNNKKYSTWSMVLIFALCLWKKKLCAQYERWLEQGNVKNEFKSEKCGREYIDIYVFINVYRCICICKSRQIPNSR